MADAELIRIEVAFAGPHVLNVTVEAKVADKFDEALRGDRSGPPFTFESQDGMHTVVLDQVVYVKRFARESRVGFGA